jgi:hypothetical protein
MGGGRFGFSRPAAISEGERLTELLRPMAMFRPASPAPSPSARLDVIDQSPHRELAHRDARDLLCNRNGSMTPFCTEKVLAARLTGLLRGQTSLDESEPVVVGELFRIGLCVAFTERCFFAPLLNRGPKLRSTQIRFRDFNCICTSSFETRKKQSTNQDRKNRPRWSASPIADTREQRHKSPYRPD